MTNSRTTSSTNTVCDINPSLRPRANRYIETAISNASNIAVETALQWGAPVNRENRAAGGLHWSTYKAICRRNGIYSNAQGPHGESGLTVFGLETNIVNAEWNAQL